MVECEVVGHGARDEGDADDIEKELQLNIAACEQGWSLGSLAKGLDLELVPHVLQLVAYANKHLLEDGHIEYDIKAILLVQVGAELRHVEVGSGGSDGQDSRSGGGLLEKVHLPSTLAQANSFVVEQRGGGTGSHFGDG